MSQPPQQNEPEQGGHDEVEERGENAALDQLTQAGNEKTHQRGNDVTSRTLFHNNFENGIYLEPRV